MKKRLVGCALLFLLLALFLAGCGNGDGGTAERTRNDPGTGPEGLSEIVFLSAYQEPAEGDDPAALSVPDNLFRISWRLKTCDNYSMDSYSQITAKVAFITYNQESWTMKDYRAGAMVQIDIAKSPFVSNAWQTCFANGEALMRGPASGKAKDWDGRNTVWDEGEPTRIERDEYFAEYGLFGTELSNYLLNEETVAAWDDLTDHGDGTYTLTVYPDLTAATGYCRERMKTMGGLDEYPTFKEISLSYTFDSAWTLLSAHIEEVYSVRLGIIRSDGCRAVTDCVYTYGSADLSDYFGYFADYVTK